MVNPNEISDIRENAEEEEVLLSNKGHELGNGGEEAIPLVAFKDKESSKTEQPEEGGGDPDAGSDKGDNTTVKKSQADFQGLTKEQLEKFVDDPFWKRLRLIFFILFWVVWAAMFIAVIVIIVVSPKCPPRPNRQFWQKPFYRLQVKSFAPASNDDPTATGSMEGLVKKMDHLRQTLGFNNFVLDSLVATGTTSGCPVDFKAHNSSLGGLDTLKTLTKQGRKKGFSFLMEFDASQADVEWRVDGGSGGGFHVGDEVPMASRNDGPAWRERQLHLPRNACPSLNVTSPGVLAKLEEAMTFWLDAGLSGFVLTNVAFMAPSGSASVGLSSDLWFAVDPTPMLFSNASVDFVRWVRRFINDQADKRGRELALFVDPGNTGYPQPEDRLAAYLDPTGGAHAVVSTGLGTPQSPQARKEPRRPRQLIEDTMKAVGGMDGAGAGVGSVAFATAWPSLRRPAEFYWTALSLLLPGVPCLYYGQEFGMAHVPGVRLLGNSLTSYLTGNDSTDASETPMQWSDSAANAGWLANDTTPLAWVNMSIRATDIQRHNLRVLSSAGHPVSELQLVQRLLKLVSSSESLQWGGLAFLPASEDLIAFKRQAVRFPPVVVVVNVADKPATLDLREAGSSKGTLKVLHSSTGASSSYEVDKDYVFDRVLAPARSTLVFIGKEEE